MSLLPRCSERSSLQLPAPLCLYVVRQLAADSCHDSEDDVIACGPRGSAALVAVLDERVHALAIKLRCNFWAKILFWGLGVDRSQLPATCCLLIM
jgi:hypothetical protein